MFEHGNRNCGCQDEQGCSCGCNSERGCSCGCGCSKCNCGCVEKFLKIADEAWAEVLKEKIKEKILYCKGEHMDKLAEMVAKANGEKWKNKISLKTKSHEFKENLREFFSSCE